MSGAPKPALPKAPFYLTAEAWIKAEWSWVRANIALHPYLATAGAFLAGVLVGGILF